MYIIVDAVKQTEQCPTNSTNRTMLIQICNRGIKKSGAIALDLKAASHFAFFYHDFALLIV